uniref:Transposase n=1 Tax=Syphacia muris TaxID=451379 RepID=A0A0N5AVE5_9BILA
MTISVIETNERKAKKKLKEDYLLAIAESHNRIGELRSRGVTASVTNHTPSKFLWLGQVPEKVQGLYGRLTVADSGYCSTVELAGKLQLSAGDKSHLKLNMTLRSIANKYQKLQRTSKTLRGLEAAKREADRVCTMMMAFSKCY